MTVNRISDSSDPLSVQRLLYETWQNEFLISTGQLANILSLTVQAVNNNLPKGNFVRYGYEFHRIKVGNQNLWKLEKIKVSKDHLDRGYV